MGDYHCAVGRVTLNYQYLEVTWALVCKLVYKRDDAQFPIPKNFSKEGVSRLLVDLKKRKDVDSTFSDRLRSVVNRRHKLTHRWILEEGTPDPQEISTFADRLSRDIIALTRVLLNLLSNELSASDIQIPIQDHDWLANLPDEYKDIQVV